MKFKLLGQALERPFLLTVRALQKQVISLVDIFFSNFSIDIDIVHEIRFIPGQFDPFSLYESLFLHTAPKSTRTQVNSYPSKFLHRSTRIHVAPKSSRTQVKSHPSQLVPKSSTCTQIKSFTSQLSPKLIRTQVNSHPSRTQVYMHRNKFATKSTRTQEPSQLPSKSAHI